MAYLSIYLQPFFKWLLQTSIQASFLICLILLVQAVLRGKVGARWQHCLWLILLIRLVMPWAPESRLSVFNLFQTLFGQGLTRLAPGTNAAMGTGGPVFQISLASVLAIIWFAGALVLIWRLLATNYVLWRKINREQKLGDERILKLLDECKSRIGVRTRPAIVLTDSVKNPALFGFFRPRLLLPRTMVEALEAEELHHIFLHELAHIKRHDLLVAHLVSLLQVLHWFNPVIWLAFYRMRVDRELACDELVLSTAGIGEPQEYGHTIIGLIERFYQKRHLPAIVGIIENKSELKRRIAMIARFKKMSKKWSLLAVLVIALIATIALTNATSSSKDDAEIRGDAPMIWVGHPEGHEASNPPEGYGGGGYGGNPGGDNTLGYGDSYGGGSESRGYVGGYGGSGEPLGYGGYSQGDNRPTTRATMKRPRSRQADSRKGELIYYGVSSEGSAPGYGASRVKDTKESDSPDSNTPAPTP